MDMKVGVQKFGRFLSGMVMPNIGAFIAWGIITMLFIPTGWLPNAQLASLVDPMVQYLLPLLIGYTGGQMVAGTRGGVVGGIVTLGVIVGAYPSPMFMGAMIAGPLGGYVIKLFDKAIAGKVRAGFEMLINNFSSGIIGALLAIVAYYVIGPVMDNVAHALSALVASIVNMGLLPLVALVVEPAKILFLNNALNHGVFTPLGAEQVREVGKSIFYLIETNPGPGLGVLLAYTLFGKGAAKASAPGAIIIHFLGGIHEIYFPYVLMMPALFLAVIAGGATGIFVNVLFDSGLVAVASPGSILAIMAVAAKGSHLGILLSVTAATAVSFVIAMPIVKFNSKEMGDDAFTQAQAQKESMKSTAKTEKSAESTSIKAIKKIIVACDAGMGSSAVGATLLKKKMAAAEVTGIEVTNSAIDAIPMDADLVITQENLAPRAEAKVEGRIPVRRLNNFMNHAFYDQLIKELKGE
ncbi:PTS mannitol transporter subunit IICB [Entomospira culicis]|uniref:protein-N(pi)-phosphohistidine--D-mannitol phosphotransferase n=1 Tax=Entomospira culicis TaxID=2719989 RepID=A0A968GIS9_9SPIO|nr:PTS mannitol transporter subunit IICBA [Entomospira culicis]NIZ19221.1 PTS mannitol transporter subunit IICBA [Entomospira culicis]NIZ69435.1 PTS mannitol transporter subunit IICBA [Entomospira culicis]WDI36551.1 PTS mannitol transporter subunit IICBA [Entomospira culicis]WDI38177.1 PTS mannitol transporter subunit IICBA [Entomospira culicis]